MNSRNQNRNIKFTFCVLAPIEMSFSLRILANPSEFPEYSAWAKRKFDSLSSNLKEEIMFFNEHYQWYFITDLLIHLVAEEEMDNISTLYTKLAQCDELTFTYIFFGLSVTEFDRETLRHWLDNPQEINLEEAPQMKKYISEDDIRYYFHHPREIRTRLINLYQQYWTEMFHREWRKIRTYEEEVLSYQRIKYQHDDPLHYLTTLHKDLVIEGGRLIFKKQDPFWINVEEIETVVIKPSIFVGNVVSGNIVDGKVTVTLNLNFHTVMSHDPAPDSLTNLIAVMNDASRLKIVKILWNYDATTKELSEILGLSPTTVSLHLKQMKKMNLVTTRKVKKFVYYQLRKDRFYGLEKRLLAYLNY